MDENVISVDDLILQSVEMENPYSTKNGKGFAQYTKDGKVYILETTFVDGKKQGVGNLKTADGEQIEVLYFHDDEQCDESEYNKQKSDVSLQPTDLKPMPSTINDKKKKRKSKLKVTNKKSNVIPTILISLLLAAIIIGLLSYNGYLYIATANQLSNGVLSLQTCNQLRHIPSWINSDVTAIKIGDGCCKGSSKVTSLSFSEFVNCQSISIAENALTELEILDVRGMKYLQSISIGEGSLRKLSVLSMDDDEAVNVSWKWTVHSSDDIHSIPVLVSDLRFEGESVKSKRISLSSSSSSTVDVLDLSPIYNLHTISFESNSLPHLSTLQLGNLPHLQFIDISNNALQNMTILTIYSNSLNSANLTDLDLSHLTNLEEITIGSNSLTGIQSVKATGLSNLHSFVIGEGSLRNVKE